MQMSEGRAFEADEKESKRGQRALCVFEGQQESQRGWSVIKESVETKVEMETGARCYGIS